MSRVAVSGLLALAACSPQPAVTTDAGAVPVASVAPPAAAAPAAGPATPECVHPLLQPDACVPAQGELDDAATDAWFEARGVPSPELLQELHVRCHEARFGPADHTALFCTKLRTENLQDLEKPGRYFWSVLGYEVRDGKAFLLVQVPFAFEESATLFSARYEIDEAEGAFTLVATPVECEHARNAVLEYNRARAHDNLVGPDEAFVARMVKANLAVREAASRRDLAFLSSVCSAAGRYEPARGGTLRRAK